jgi:hypothetical protein
LECSPVRQTPRPRFGPVGAETLGTHMAEHPRIGQVLRSRKC